MKPLNASFVFEISRIASLSSCHHLQFQLRGIFCTRGESNDQRGDRIAGRKPGCSPIPWHASAIRVDPYLHATRHLQVGMERQNNWDRMEGRGRLLWIHFGKIEDYVT